MIFASAEKGYADRNTYTMKFEEVRLSEAISELARQTDIDLSFDPANIPDEVVTYNFEDETATAILFALIRPYRLTSYLLPNGVFVIAPSIKRELQTSPDIRFDKPDHGPVSGRIYSFNDETIKLLLIGSVYRTIKPEGNGAVTMPVYTQPLMLYLVGHDSKPLRISPYDLSNNFDLEAPEITRQHPYPIQ